jgi:hypothetical protein
MMVPVWKWTDEIYKSLYVLSIDIVLWIKKLMKEIFPDPDSTCSSIIIENIYGLAEAT